MFGFFSVERLTKGKTTTLFSADVSRCLEHRQEFQSCSCGKGSFPLACLQSFLLINLSPLQFSISDLIRPTIQEIQPVYLYQAMCQKRVLGNGSVFFLVPSSFFPSSYSQLFMRLIFLNIVQCIDVHPAKMSGIAEINIQIFHSFLTLADGVSLFIEHFYNLFSDQFLIHFLVCFVTIVILKIILIIIKNLHYFGVSVFLLKPVLNISFY